LGVGVADPNFLHRTICTPAGIAAKRAADTLAAAGAGGGGGGGGSGSSGGDGDSGGDGGGHH
jgi:hypothetical protein